jgi:uncharacterized membrane protein YoaT (DUF817 family)
MPNTQCDGGAFMGNMKSLWGELAQEVVLFSGLAVAIVLLQGSSAVALTVLLAIALATLALWHDPYDRWSFFIVAVFGTCAEVFFVHYGVWRYANPDLLGIPLWFPVAFATSALIGERLIRTVTRTRKRFQKSRV